MKGISYLCTNHVNFHYDGKIYIQIGRVAMESPLDPLLADILILSLEEATLKSIKNHVAHWRRFVHDTYEHIDASKFNLF